MTDELKEEAFEHINEEVKFGFDSKEVIFERTLDLFYNEQDIDKDWIMQKINTAYTIQQEKSRLWTKPTDFDKLEMAFTELIKNNIICLHMAGNTKQEGQSDCEEANEMLSEKGFKMKGYCFYHVQDLQRAVGDDISNLLLGFDSFDDNDITTVAIGNTIVQTLEKYGFQINWPGTATQRIEIQHIKWQKLPDGQNWWLTRPLEILMQQKPIAKPATKPASKPWWKVW